MISIVKACLNVFKAPKSTLLALLLLAGFTYLQYAKIVEKDLYSVLVVAVIPLMFGDLMKEKKDRGEID